MNKKFKLTFIPKSDGVTQVIAEDESGRAKVPVILPKGVTAEKAHEIIRDEIHRHLHLHKALLDLPDTIEVNTHAEDEDEESKEK